MEDSHNVFHRLVENLWTGVATLPAAALLELLAAPAWTWIIAPDFPRDGCRARRLDASRHGRRSSDLPGLFQSRLVLPEIPQAFAGIFGISNGAISNGVDP